LPSSRSFPHSSRDRLRSLEHQPSPSSPPVPSLPSSRCSSDDDLACDPGLGGRHVSGALAAFRHRLPRTPSRRGVALSRSAAGRDHCRACRSGVVAPAGALTRGAEPLAAALVVAVVAWRRSLLAGVIVGVVAV